MHEVEELLKLVARLRDPRHGCTWDRAQTYATIAPYTVEQACEVADAVARDDRTELKNELGDLLFHVVFHAQLAMEEGAFDFADVAAAITAKMIRRHPHVFGSAQYADYAGHTTAWERSKAAEREVSAASVLDGVPMNLPALSRALKLQRNAAAVGFDWPEPAAVLDKIVEEAAELRAELTAATVGRLLDELGDLLFACVNLARHLGVDPDIALRGANAKFERRFRCIETWLVEAGRAPAQATLDELEALWERTKAEERDRPLPQQHT